MTTPPVSIEVAFGAAMVACGLNPPDIIADGVLRRFDSDDDRRGRKSGWYVLHGDGTPAGAFGNWSTGLSETWRIQTHCAMTPMQRAEYRRRIGQARQDAKITRLQLEAGAAKACRAIIATAHDATDDNPYCIRKGIEPYGLKEFRNSRTLIVPVRDGNGNLVSLQFIAASGVKRFKTQGKIAGCYYSFGGKPVDALLICEGFATGASLHAVTGLPVAVTFTAGNLEAVARVLRTKMPTIQMIVCADNDRFRDSGNVGLTKATAAARAVDGLLAIPQFISDAGRPTDFNDLHQIEGALAVMHTIAKVQVAATRRCIIPV